MADLVKQALAELGDLVGCHCHPAYKDRGLHDPDCHCDEADNVKMVADRIEALTVERDALSEKLARAVLGLVSVRNECDQITCLPSHGAIKCFCNIILGELEDLDAT